MFYFVADEYKRAQSMQQKMRANLMMAKDRMRILGDLLLARYEASCKNKELR